MEYENPHNKMDYYMLGDIRVFTGITEYTNKLIENNIKYNKSIIQSYYLDKNTSLDKNVYNFSVNDDMNLFELYEKFQNIENDIFTPLISSTITVKGSMSNISFNEKEKIKTFEMPKCGNIVKICCNYGEIINENSNYVPPPPKVKSSNRGRKPKIKTPSTRNTKEPFTGLFNSQLTFVLYNEDTCKIYKVKLFRNGVFQIPGSGIPDISDLVKPINTLKKYLISQFLDENIKVNYLISVMRNYICRLKNKNQFIKLNELENILKKRKKENLIDNILHKFLETNKNKFLEKYNISLKTIDFIKEYIGEYENNIQVAEIQNNCERYFGLIIKFNRPVPWKINKRTTIKILKSGKINIDGSNSIKESIELYLWLINLFIKHKDEIIYDSTIETIIESDTDYDIESGYSVYDDDGDEIMEK